MCVLPLIVLALGHIAGWRIVAFSDAYLILLLILIDLSNVELRRFLSSLTVCGDPRMSQVH